MKLKRITDSKRVPAKLRALKDGIERRQHLPIPEQGRWLASVLRGHYNYYAVPDNSEALHAFRRQAEWHWFRALQRRSQRTTLTWERMSLLASMNEGRVSSPSGRCQIADAFTGNRRVNAGRVKRLSKSTEVNSRG